MELGKMFRIPWLLLIVVVAIRSDDVENIDNVNNVNDVAAIQAANADDTRRNIARTQAAADAPANWNVQNCYTCSDCEHIQFNTTVTACPHHADSEKMHQCVTYIEKYKSFGKPWYVRGCASEKGNCADIRKSHTDAQNDIVKLIYCKECEGDLCNGVSRSLPLAFLYFVATPILTKLALA